MSGGERVSETGQLALMDSLIFFMVATTISSILLFYSLPGLESESLDHGQGMADPREVLQSLLHSSVGKDVLVPLDPPRHISRSTDISQCLLLEAEAILDGMDAEVFTVLNSDVYSVLRSITNPSYQPRLAVLVSNQAGYTILFSISDVRDNAGRSYSADFELSTDDEKDLLVQLVLCPSALSEVVDALM